MESSYNYWESYYEAHRDPSLSSNFSKFVLPFLKENHTLIELGCGNGKDSIFFAQNKIKVLAIDQCVKELDFLTEKFKDFPDLNFLSADMTNLKDVPKSDYIYSRFTLHAIDLEGEGRVHSWAKNNLNENGILFIEVRSINDELYGQGTPMPDNAFFTDHYRRFMVLEEIIDRITSVGLKIIYKLESKGLAPYKDQDPSIIRILAMK